MNKEDHFHSQQIQFFKTGLADFDSEGIPGKHGRDAWKTRKLKTIITELGHDKVSECRFFDETRHITYSKKFCVCCKCVCCVISPNR